MKWTELTQAPRYLSFLLRLAFDHMRADFWALIYWFYVPADRRNPIRQADPYWLDPARNRRGVRLSIPRRTRLGASTGRFITTDYPAHQHTRAIGFQADHRRVEVGHVTQTQGPEASRAGRPGAEEADDLRHPSPSPSPLRLRGPRSRASRVNKKVKP